MSWAGHQNKEIMVAAQCSLNTVKTIRHKLENCNGDYKAVARRKQHNRRSDCVRTTELLENLQKKCWRTLRYLRGVAKHCSQSLDNKGS